MLTVALRQLEERVRQVERREAMAGGPGVGPGAGPVSGSAVDWGRALVGAVDWPRGAVHEWFAEDGPAVGILRWLARGAGRKGQESGVRGEGVGEREGGVVVWIGRACWPYPAGSGDFGESTLFVDPVCDADRLWAVELCARSPAVTGVVADGRGLDMPATRRLQLAARDGDTRVFLARPKRELNELSAAAGRWLVEPAPSPDRHPRWSVEMVRCKGLRPWQHSPSAARASMPGARWVVEYRDDTGLVPVSADVADRSAPAAPTAASHAADLRIAS